MRRSEARTGAATIPDVARAAGVSTATAARALGGYGSVSPASRHKVLAAAERLGYRPNSLARSMITGVTHTIGVVVADIENPFFSRALRGITDTARAAGMEVILTNTDEDPRIERDSVHLLLEKRVDGLVVCPADGDSAHLSASIAAGIPVVLLDRGITGLPADTVGIDNVVAARSATEHLLSLGHRRIGLLTGGDSWMRERLAETLDGAELFTATTVGGRTAGYRDALLAAGITPRTEYVSADGFHRADAADATRRLLGLPEPPTAILALDALLALGALQALHALGRRCPADVSLLGFDDADWAEVVSPPLSVIAQPVYEIGAEACRLLLDRVRGDNRPHERRVLPTTFIARESTAPPPT